MVFQTGLDLELYIISTKMKENAYFEPILQVSSSETSIPDIYYLRNCRSTFTHKKSLCTAQSKVESDDGLSGAGCSTDQRRSQREQLTTKSHVYQKVCIFCDKSSKYMKGSRTKEPLIQARELRADNKVLEVATMKVDRKILAITSRELVAAEAHYHKTCYRDYTRGYKCVDTGNLCPDDTNTCAVKVEPSLYADAEDAAYKMLF